ncbi:glycoside hydrolase family 2 protein [Snuella lapsa]|uniref:beta-galactosidase n=1 Tax=Snuella lapsa TaxID=870481 RepID=A0ABP6XNP0_9FLAO
MKNINTTLCQLTILIYLLLIVPPVWAQQKNSSILSDANVTIPRISPLPIKVNNVATPVLSLDGEWQVAIEKGNNAPIQVPGELLMQGFNLNIGETAYYTKHIEIPEDWKNKKIFVRFDGVSSHAIVKLNGKKITEHEGSFAPFEANITKAINTSNNILEVEVKANTISDILACTSQYAAHTVAGILRKVTLFVLPESNIEDITTNTTFDKKFNNANLSIETKIDQPSTGLQLRYTLYNANNKKVFQKNITVNGNTSTANIPVKKPNKWNAESPYLYVLTTELLQDKEILQKNEQKVGFRQIQVIGSELYVNGKPVKLHGVNRHSVHPITGRSLSPEMERLDAELFKKANCNYIRTSHYPPSEEFLNAADELGLFVESEASLTWIQHGASPIWGHWDYKDGKFLPYFLQANLDNVQANKNHPSVIIWSLANESRWSPLWDKVNQVVKQMDPHRPTSFHDQCWGGFNNAGSTADIANYHYPGIDGPAATDSMTRPTLFGEYAHLSTYNRRELLTDPGVRDAYNIPLVKFYDSIYAHKNNLGGAIWSGIDDIFHLPDGRIVGYGPWGPIDGWRRPKPEYYGMKKAYSPVRVNSVQNLKGKLLINVENRYDFTPFSSLKIVAEINGLNSTIKSNIQPRHKGIITIPFKDKVNSLKLTFYNANNHIVEEEFYNFNEENIVSSKLDLKLSYSENKESYLIQQGTTSYRIDKLKGKIVSITKGNKAVVLQGPEFTIVEMNSENGGKNNIAGETYQRIVHPLQSFPWYMKYASDIKVHKKENAIEMELTVTYKEGKGKLWYIFKSDGQFTTKYEIEQTNGETKPYQYGLLLQVPKTYQTLEWERKGDFSIYPSDHIGRNKGKTKLNAKITDGVEPWRIKPTHPWKDEANELGSNDFRSTKRNIIKASLSDEKTKINVLSNSHQASRSWVQEENIHWLIADYWNNGSERFYGTPHSEGRISTKNRVLKGELTLVIE